MAPQDLPHRVGLLQHTLKRISGSCSLRELSKDIVLGWQAVMLSEYVDIILPGRMQDSAWY